MSTPNSFDADVLIVGAGPAGLALGAALADQGLHCTLLEQQPASALADPAEDGREIALTHRARRVMQALGLWERLPADEIAPLQAAHVLDGSSPLVLHFGAGAAAAADAPLGWLVANHLIRRAAWQAAAARPALQVLCEARVQAIERNADAAAVHLADGRVLRGRLLVAADSRFSATRRLAGIGAAMHDFGRSVVVGRVRHERPHGGVAWECFRYGNTLALLPMAGGRRASAVVTVGGERADEWLALSDADFAARIQAQSDGRLGAVQAEGPRHHYPLVGVYAQRFAAPRFALIGDAAVGMHPVTAHGWNFGLYGVEVLARELGAQRRAGGDLGALAPLQRYESEHRRATLPVWLGTNAIVGLFTDERRLPRLARRAVLTLAERAPGLSRLIKSGIERQLTGAAA
ncbi:MAG: 5-demethoxyubiquinol-8 5-hydroxylase UbiM [Proteobacteria bacterium]|nr:5-demethoxyubiquinol-8 5-hydroxylase UbiM [Pseudomonadota bacterium]